MINTDEKVSNAEDVRERFAGEVTFELDLRGQIDCLVESGGTSILGTGSRISKGLADQQRACSSELP